MGWRSSARVIHRILAQIILGSVWVVSGCAARAEKTPVVPDTPPLFSRGEHALHFSAEDFPLHPQSGARMTSSADCAPCHKIVYNNWHRSRHRSAATNELYREGFAVEPSPWCANCHGPLRAAAAQAKAHTDEGISCLVCHARGGDILTANPDLTFKPGAHRYRHLAKMKTEEFCENCHEFNFPTAQTAMKSGDALRFSHSPMQSTVSEHRSSFYFRKQTCSGCHLNSGSALTHSFPGGHSLKMLQDSLAVTVKRVHRDYVHVKIFASGIGHAFPTGDLFRTLRLSLSDEATGAAKEILMRHDFRPATPEEVRAGSAAKIRVRNDTIGPPLFDHVATREYDVEWPAASRSVTATLSLRYISDFSMLTTKLGSDKTELVIRSENVVLGSFR